MTKPYLSKVQRTMAASAAVLFFSSIFLGLDAASANATPSAERCGFVTMITVRGTSESAGSGSSNGGRTYASGGSGSMLQSLVDRAEADTNFPTHVEAINYPGVVLDPNNPLETNFVTSVQQGIDNLVAEINDVAQTCPHTNIVLAGYSQGATVIGNSIGAYHGSSLSVPAVSLEAHEAIAGVLLFGDPGFRPYETWNRGSATGSGVLESVAGQYSNMTRQGFSGPRIVVASYCFTGDFFCQKSFTGEGMAVHASYGASSAPQEAWAFTTEIMTDLN